MQPFTCRIAQLDLARQMETPSFIRTFIDLLSANHYNMLMLYLEDRVITPCFPYPAPNEGYTMDEIRELVAYGEQKGIELFPCVATLGHAELFLKYPEMQKFAEVKEGTTGRFGGTVQNTFCISEPGFYEFLFQYLKEVASLFPSKYFHIGLDEFWDFNRCPKCKAQAPDFDGEQRLFLKHILKVHDFLQKLGKRTAMWSDMFENYRDILPEVPRDVIMVEWQYQDDVRFNLAHFDNSAVTDNFRRFSNLGFDIWLAPHDMKLNNPVTAVKYAEQEPKVTGMLLTSWERSDTYWPRYLPMFAIVGHLFSGESLNTALPLIAQQLFGLDDPYFVQLLQTTLSQHFLRHFESSTDSVFFSRSHLGLNEAENQAMILIRKELELWQKKICRGQEIWTDLIQLFDEMILSFNLKKEYLDSLDFGLTPERLKAIRKYSDDYKKLFRERTAMWEQQRPGITPNVFALRCPAMEKHLEDALTRLQKGSFLKLRLMHADWYGAPRLTISLKQNGKWHQVQDGVLKPDNLNHQLTEYFIAVPENLISSEAMKIQCSGYGGVGIAYAELRQDAVTVKIPGRIVNTDNKVSDPENILQNNSCWSFLGDQPMHKVFCDQNLAKIQAGIELTLKNN